MKKQMMIGFLGILAVFVSTGQAQNCKQGQDAIDYYIRAIEADGSDFKSYFCLGDLFYDGNKPVHALRNYLKGVRIIERDIDTIAENKELLEKYQEKCAGLGNLKFQDEKKIENHLDKKEAVKLGVRPKIPTYIEFDTNRTVIKEDWQAQLDALAEVLKKDKMKSYRFIIQGHTDIRGTEKDKYKLSVGRAEAVQQYLRKSGIPSSVLSTDAKGESRPLKHRENESEADWLRRNRRVVFVSCDKNDNTEHCLKRAKAD